MNSMQSRPSDSKYLAESSFQAPRRMQSEALLGNAKELVIVHKGREYRLRLTQNGKLILTA